MIKEAIVKIVNKEDLTYDEAYTVMNEIMSGQTSETQNAAFLAALSTKSARAETTDEIAGCAAAMRAHATRVETGMELFEIVGTGGDHAQSFNISTTAALVAAAAGMKVAKHGNRAASSQCGTADCLEALGVNIHQNPKKCLELLNEAGMCFFFAQEYHTSMKYVGAIRKELGFRTVFNILGPLTNPGTPTMQLLGVYDEYLVEPLAQVLLDLGIRRGMVVYGQDKLDEISMSAATTVCEIRDGWFRTFVLTPEEFGFERCSKEDLKGGTPKENAEITLAILKGEKGPKRNAVLLNAGAALYIGEKADSIKAGIALAEELIDSGKALDTLQKLIEGSNRGEGCMTILEQLAGYARERTEKAKQKRPLSTLRQQAFSMPKGSFAFENAIKKPELSFICECKKASPSRGIIVSDFPYIQIAKEYENAGADCISVLTEPGWFLGKDAYLREIAEVVYIPCLRKDFTVDEYMLYEAKVLGASAVLLICSILSERQIQEYIGICDEMGISALVEAHDEKEVTMAVRAGARLIGINNRNLKDFTVDTDNSRRFREMIPPEILFVSESGICSAEDVKRLREIGTDAVLIGEALMRTENKAEKLAWLRGAI